MFSHTSQNVPFEKKKERKEGEAGGKFSQVFAVPNSAIKKSV